MNGGKRNGQKILLNAQNVKNIIILYGLQLKTAMAMFIKLKQ
jgi:hypothetical protein